MRGANTFEPVHTSAPDPNHSEPEKIIPFNSEAQPNPNEPVRTSADVFEPVLVKPNKEIKPEPSSHPFEHVQNRSEIETVLDEVRARMSDKDNEIAFLRGQLADAQAEIGRRAASTDEALKTIDRVVRSFEMQAEANKALALRGGEQAPYREATEPIRFTPESVDNHNRHQDIRRV